MIEMIYLDTELLVRGTSEHVTETRSSPSGGQETRTGGSEQRKSWLICIVISFIKGNELEVKNISIQKFL